MPHLSGPRLAALVDALSSPDIQSISLSSCIGSGRPAGAAGAPYGASGVSDVSGASGASGASFAGGRRLQPSRQNPIGDRPPLPAIRRVCTTGDRLPNRAPPGRRGSLLGNLLTAALTPPGRRRRQ